MATQEAIRRLDLPINHEYGKYSSAAKFVEHFVEGAEWHHQVFTESELRRAYNAGFADRCGIAEGDHSQSFDKYFERNGLK